jgi:nucleoside-diphosphate-sugar epimerase
MPDVLVVGGPAALQEYVIDALAGRGRSATTIEEEFVALPDTATIDSVVAASSAVIYLDDDGHERRRSRTAPASRSTAKWAAVSDAVKAHEVPCVSTAKNARQGQGVVTEVRLPEVYGLGRSAVRGLASQANPQAAAKLMRKANSTLPSLVDEYAMQAIARRSINVDRDGSALVNAVLVDDMAEILVDALVETETNGDVNKPVVFGDDQATSEIDIANLVTRIAYRYNGGVEVKVVTRPTRYFGHHQERGKGRGDVSNLDAVGWSVERLTALDDGVILVMSRMAAL